MYRDSIGETRMCVQQILPQHHNELKAIYQSDLSPENQQRLRAAFFSKKLWPAGSKIRIGFLDSGKQISKTSAHDMRETGKGKMDPLQDQVAQMSVHQMIRKIVRERIQPLVDLQITFVDKPEQANVRISFDPTGGAWSLVGTDHLHQKSGATMNLGWFDVATTMHEFGHMLGMIHEHQNPKGDKIKWNDSEVFAWAQSTQGWSDKTTEENIIQRYNRDSINGSSFDPLSIMLYFFPASLTTNKVGTHQNLRLSGLDVLWIHKTYPSKDKITPEKFYEQVYKQNLESSIKESEREAKQFDKGGAIDWKSIGIGVLIVVIILLIVSVIWWFVTRKRATGRYDRLYDRIYNRV